MLPTMDGWKICSYLRQQKLNYQILMLTAKAMPEDRVRGFETGADDYMTKPFDVRELMIRVERLLEKRRKMAAFHDFIRMINHEVANKMNIISGMSDVLHNKEQGMDDDRERTFLKHINKAAHGTTELISEIRMLLDVEAGEFVLHPDRMNIPRLIEDIVKQNKDAALQKGLNFDIRVEGAITELELDRVAVKQVFANIIGNAMKYSRNGGGISISIEQEENSLIVKVKDNGCGIPENDLLHIFERGYRAKNAANTFNGSGTGLYIVKLLLDKMGAGIEVKSEEGTGSEFIVTFKIPDCNQIFTLPS